MQRNWSIHNRPEEHGDTCPAPSYLLPSDSTQAGAKPKFSLQSNNLTEIGASECYCSARIEKNRVSLHSHKMQSCSMETQLEEREKSKKYNAQDIREKINKDY